MFHVFLLLSFWSGLIAIRYASYHFQDRSIPTPLRYENHAEKNPFQWKQKAYPIWKLERSDSDPVRWKHIVLQHCKENFANSGSFWNTEMIKTDKFAKRKCYNFLFCVFRYFDRENKLLIWNCVCSLNFVILSLLH